MAENRNHGMRLPISRRKDQHILNQESRISSQGQRQLTHFAGKDLDQELIAPCTAASLHRDTPLVWMLLQ